MYSEINRNEMSKNMKQKGLLMVAALFGLCLGGWLGRVCNAHHAEDGMAQDTVIVRDTVRTISPMAADSVAVGVMRVPMVTGRHIGHDGHIGQEMQGDTAYTTAGVQNMGNTGVADTVWATVPRMQKRYEDSLYTAWVSGYEPRLDSIEVYRERLFVTQTVTKRGRFNVGLTGGFGYGIFTRKPDIFVGIGCTLRLW